VSNSPSNTVWIGYDSRQAAAFAVAKYSLRKYERNIPVYGLVLDSLRDRGLYRRPMEMRDGKMYDVISDAPMSTEFSNSRFLVPYLAKTGMALFCDCDVLFRTSVARLFDMVSYGSKAVYCVKHDHQPTETTKMDGQVQTRYYRKNWSSVMIFNCDHPSNQRLTLEMINSLPGRDLHRFCWLEDDEIGALPQEWNYLVGHSKQESSPSLIHFTNGLPDIEGYEDQEFANVWLAMKPHAVGAL